MFVEAELDILSIGDNNQINEDVMFDLIFTATISH